MPEFDSFFFLWVLETLMTLKWPKFDQDRSTPPDPESHVRAVMRYSHQETWKLNLDVSPKGWGSTMVRFHECVLMENRLLMEERKCSIRDCGIFHATCSAETEIDPTLDVSFQSDKPFFSAEGSTSLFLEQARLHVCSHIKQHVLKSYKKPKHAWRIPLQCLCVSPNNFVITTTI